MWKRLSPQLRVALWLGVITVIFLALLLAVLGIASIFTANSREGKAVTFTYGTGLRSDRSVEKERGVLIPQGVPYADFTILANACFYSQSGDENEIRYVLKIDKDTYDTVTFYYDSRKAIVNGMHITLSAPVRRVGQSVLVPCEFIETYMNGVTVTVSAEKIRVIYDTKKLSLKPSISSIKPIEPNE